MEEGEITLGNQIFPCRQFAWRAALNLPDSHAFLSQWELSLCVDIVPPVCVATGSV